MFTLMWQIGRAKLSYAPYSSDNVLLHQGCCIRSICFLYTLSLSIITEAPSLMLEQFKKLSRFTLHSVLHSKQHLTYNLKRSLLLSKVLSRMARQAAIQVPLTGHIMKMLSYLYGNVNQGEVAGCQVIGAIHLARHTVGCIYLCEPGLFMWIRLI